MHTSVWAMCTKTSGDLVMRRGSYRRALEIDPAFHEAHTSLLFCLSHDESVDPKTLFAEHRNFAERFEGPLRPGWPVHGNVRDPARCLSIGFVSGDFRTHAVAYFIEPLLRHLAEFRTLSLHAYSNHAADDDVTKRLRRHFQALALRRGPFGRGLGESNRPGSHRCTDRSLRTYEPGIVSCFCPQAGADSGQLDRVSGHHRISRAVDYYFADDHFLPLDEFGDGSRNNWCICRLPPRSCRRLTAPPVNALPALSNGYLTFGSFNQTEQVGPAVDRDMVTTAAGVTEVRGCCLARCHRMDSRTN